MHIRTKLAVATLTLGTTFANAQSFDFAREAKENFEGASAAACLGWGAVLSVDLGPSHEKFQSITGMMKTAAGAAAKAYGSKDIAKLKADSLAIPAAQSLDNARQVDPGQYAALKARVFKQVDNCSIIYPPEATPSVK